MQKVSDEQKASGINDIDSEDLCHIDQLSSLRVDELELYINHHSIAFKVKKY